MNTKLSKRILSSSACVLVLLVTPAFADIGKGNWEVGFGLGATNFDSNVSDKTGFYLDVRGGYFLNDTFQLEGQLSGSDVEEGFMETSLTTLFANAVFNFRPKKHVVPYVLFGVGSTTLEFAVSGVSVEDDATSYQAAVGSRFFVGSKKKMAVRVELVGMSEDTFDDRSTHISLTGGLTWRLGAAR